MAKAFCKLPNKINLRKILKNLMTTQFILKSPYLNQKKLNLILRKSLILSLQSVKKIKPSKVQDFNILLIINTLSKNKNLFEPQKV